MKKILVSILIILLVVVLGFFVLKKVDDKGKEEFVYTPLMYKICDDNSCIYLLGSIHIGDARVNKFSNVILDAYHASDELAVELDLNEVTVDLGSLMLDSGTIEDYISPELNDKLTKFAEEHPMFTYQQFKSFKIGYIYDYLSMLPYLEEGYTSEGVDSYFMKLARDDNKPIISLEKYEDQLNLLIGYSDQFYIDQINTMIDLYDTYLSGDEEKISALIQMEEDDSLQTEEGKRFIKDVYDNRNIAMANRVKDFLSNDEKVFMVVGCAHVVGDKGIVTLLKDNYKISIVK